MSFFRSSEIYSPDLNTNLNKPFYICLVFVDSDPNGHIHNNRYSNINIKTQFFKNIY